ncbi:hypothetical protein PQI07_10970 [Methylobacterium sp. 092160098-2]|nr:MULTISPECIES: hypothetical protein [Methylobacterium]MDE4911215.1 hypothetical protein [Methylobacterium sp. 092160098-2]
MQGDNEEVIIDLDALGGGPATFERLHNADGRRPDAGGSRVIRRDAFRRVLTKLVANPSGRPETEDLYARRPQALDVMPNRSHDAILISARRGDGKTTFLTDLLALIQDVQNGSDDFRHYLDGAVPNDQVGRLYSLGIIDPTLIEAKQHIVVIIIEKIKAAVDHLHERTSGDKASYDAFKTRLYDLAAGLTLLDGIGESMLQGKDWADPDFVLDKGLDRAGAAGGFERAFRRYVVEACTFLKVDAFVLAIDDVDTSFDRGWPVLEALRKYLAAPQLKVVLAGDLKLYNLLVRQQQWKQMTKEFVEVERTSTTDRSYRDQIIEMVDLLQDQYLIKIARPENRLDLRNLLHYANKSNLSFIASKHRNSMRLNEREVFDRYADRLFALGSLEERAVIRSTLLRLPLRSSLQALAGAWRLISTVPPVARPGEASGTRQTWEEPDAELTRDALDALRSVASQSLMTLDLDHEALLEADPNRIIDQLSQWMTDKNLWLNMDRFFPQGKSEGNDIVSLLIAGTLTNLFQLQPRTIIDYWLKICTVREVFDRSISSSDDMRAVLRDQLKIEASENSIQFVSRLSAWEVGAGGQVRPGLRLSGISIPASLNLERSRQQGYMERLYGLSVDFDRETFSSIANGNEDGPQELDERQLELINALPVPLRTYHRTLMRAGWSYNSRRGSEAGLTAVFANSLESLERRLPPDIAAVAMIPANRARSGQLAEITSYSILRLIGFVGEVLAIGARVPAADRAQAIAGLLSTFSLLRSYPSPGLGGSSSVARATSVVGGDDVEDPEDDGEETSASDELPSDPHSNDQELHSLLEAWLYAILEEPPPSISTVTLARIWTRFTYAFDNVVEELRHTKTRYLGVLMHRAIIVFWHAVGVEALKAAGRAPTTKTIRNPTVSGLPFWELLQEIDAGERDNAEFRQKMWIFEAIFSCPVWGYFTARDDGEIDDGKINYADEIYNEYAERLSRINLRPSYGVVFKTTNSGGTIRFDGLYPLLNTIPIQVSKRAPNSAVAQNLKRILQKYAEPKSQADSDTDPAPRRTRRRSSPDSNS